MLNNMKQETISQANAILKRIEAYKEFKEKISVPEKPSKPEYLNYIKTSIYRHNDNNRELMLSLNNDGTVDIRNISETGKVLLAHTIDTYMKSLHSIIDSEISNAQKEFDNLKD